MKQQEEKKFEVLLTELCQMLTKRKFQMPKLEAKYKESGNPKFINKVKQEIDKHEKKKRERKNLMVDISTHVRQ